MISYIYLHVTLLELLNLIIMYIVDVISRMIIVMVTNYDITYVCVL